jgi:hypothetical protein
MASDETVVHRPAVRRARRPRLGCLAPVLNLVSILLLALTCVNGLGFAILFIDPQLLAIVPGGSAFVAPTVPLPVVVAGPSTPGGPGTTVPGTVLVPTFPPEWTPQPTPTASNTPLPNTATPIPSETSTVVVRTKTPTPTPTRSPTPRGPTATPSATRSAYNYTLQAGSPSYMANFTNQSGCAWFGIGGQVFGADGRPQIGLTVHVEINGSPLEALTGSNLAVGPGGYLIPLGTQPAATTDTYQIELRNNTGTALSAKYAVKTFAECPKNMVVVNFVQNH